MKNQLKKIPTKTSSLFKYNQSDAPPAFKTNRFKSDPHTTKIIRKPLYTQEDIADLPHLNSQPGEAPFLRGPYKSMYSEKPWTIRQYAGFADAVDTNQLFRNSLAEGALGLSVAFDLPTHRGYDSDCALISDDVGMAGVAIDSVEDMKLLFAGIALNQVSVSMTMSGSVLPIMAAYIVAAEESGVAAKQLTGTIQNDILKEFMVRNTYIFAPNVSLRIATDVADYIAAHLPRFNAMSISGYHLQEAGANATLELALTLANGLAYIKQAQQRGLNIDQFCERLSFFFGVGSDFYGEIAKLRAARVLWCDLVTQLGITSVKAKALRMHCQTSGWSLTAQDPLNNIARTTMQAMAAAFGGTQSLHTNAYDEAVSLPTKHPSTIARNTQLILQHETGICDVIDPWAGSYMMESLTAEMVKSVKKTLAEIDAQGGVIAALESGWVHACIQENAAQTQAEIDNGKRIIIGLNQYKSSLNQTPPDYLTVNNAQVKTQQIHSLKALKINRDQLAVKRALKNLTFAAQQEKSNLLAATILAIKARATVGECTAALEQVWPRYKHTPTNIKNCYGAALESDTDWQLAVNSVQIASQHLGRKPRLLMSKIGQDGHDRGANVVASTLTDAGFDVHLLPLFQTPQQIAHAAHHFQADIVGVSSLAGSHLQTLPALVQALNQYTKKIPLVAGGTIPIMHIESLKSQGVQAVFTAGQPITQMIQPLLNILLLQH